MVILTFVICAFCKPDGVINEKRLIGEFLLRFLNKDLTIFVRELYVPER